MQHKRHRLAGYVQERFCAACDSPGVHYTLLKHRDRDDEMPLVQFEATCPDCTYHWLETYERVPNSWMDDHE